MNGIELSRQYYEDYGKKMLYDNFSDICQYIAVGICGQGSECYGYDDEISRDHDFEPGFIIFLPDENIVDRKKAFSLERAYSKLPKEFCGISRLKIAPVGGYRHGVKRTSEFFQNIIGIPDGIISLSKWLKIPDYLLCEATNGEIFEDNYGEVTRIRKRLSAIPEDIRIKKLASRLIIMAQAGQYNYPRCLAHGETAAAQLALYEFTHRAMEAVFLLNHKFMPYYKWAFRAMRELKILNKLSEHFEFLISTDNLSENAVLKQEITENICAAVAKEIEKQNITKADNELERLAYAVNDTIKDVSIRAQNIFCSI